MHLAPACLPASIYEKILSYCIFETCGAVNKFIASAPEHLAYHRAAPVRLVEAIANLRLLEFLNDELQMERSQRPQVIASLETAAKRAWLSPE